MPARLCSNWNILLPQLSAFWSLTRVMMMMMLLPSSSRYIVTGKVFRNRANAHLFFLFHGSKQWTQAACARLMTINQRKFCFRFFERTSGFCVSTRYSNNARERGGLNVATVTQNRKKNARNPHTQKYEITLECAHLLFATVCRREALFWRLIRGRTTISRIKKKEAQNACVFVSADGRDSTFSQSWRKAKREMFLTDQQFGDRSWNDVFFSLSTVSRRRRRSSSSFTTS